LAPAFTNSQQARRVWKGRLLQWGRATTLLRVGALCYDWMAHLRTQSISKHTTPGRSSRGTHMVTWLAEMGAYVHIILGTTLLGVCNKIAFISRTEVGRGGAEKVDNLVKALKRRFGNERSLTTAWAPTSQACTFTFAHHPAMLLSSWSTGILRAKNIVPSGDKMEWRGCCGGEMLSRRPLAHSSHP